MYVTDNIIIAVGRPRNDNTAAAAFPFHTHKSTLWRTHFNAKTQHQPLLPPTFHYFLSEATQSKISVNIYLKKKVPNNLTTMKWRLLLLQNPAPSAIIGQSICLTCLSDPKFSLRGWNSSWQDRRAYYRVSTRHRPFISVSIPRPMLLLLLLWPGDLILLQQTSGAAIYKGDHLNSLFSAPPPQTVATADIDS